MELEKKYPWIKNMPIPSKSLEEWKSQDSIPSLTLWSLKKQLIDKRQYIHWAVDYYQIPLVRELFFEKYTMTKEDWDEIKEKYNWTEEIFPVALWNKSLFLGCVEPKEIPILGFKVLPVLVSHCVLETRWHFIQSFLDHPNKNTIFKEETQNTGYKVKQSEKSPITLGKAKPNTVLQAPYQGHVKATFQPDLPQQNKSPLKVLPSLQKPEQKPSLPLTQIAQTQPPIQSGNSEAPLKKPDSKKALEQDLSNKAEQIQNLAKKGDFQKPQLNVVNSGSTQTATYSDNSTTATSFSVTRIQEEYDFLWKYTSNYYNASLILDIKENGIADFVAWNGTLKLDNTQLSINLNEGASLFKVVQKGLPYHGFVIDNPFHKKFFNQIGWSKYPKHLMALPIKDSNHKLKKIFVGLSIKNMPSREEYLKIETQILKFFNTKSQQALVA